MEDKETIIKFLLDKVSELNQENKRLNDALLQVQVDCYCCSNWLNDRKEEEEKKWEVMFVNWESRIAQNFDQVKERIMQEKVVNIREMVENELPF